MEEIIYITPNGTEVDEATLRNQFGDLFDQLVTSGQLKKKDFTQDTVSQSQVGTSDLPEPEFTQEEDGFFERTFGKSGITDLIDDTFVNIRQGIAQGASLNEALKLQRKGSRATKQDIQQYADAVGRMQSIPVTDEMMDFQKIYEENDKSWLGFIKGISKNPSVLSGVIAQSMASMVNPTVAFGAVKGAGAGALTGLAAGAATGPGAGVTALTGAKLGAIAGLTNTLEGGLAFTEFLQEEIEKKGLEFNDDSIAAILNDDEAFRKVKSRTKARGYSIALVNTITAGVASQLARSGRNIKRLGDLKVGGVTVPTSRVLPGPQTAIRSGTEFVGGGLGEVAGRAAAGQEMDVAEIGFEAFGELGSPEAIIPSFKNATYEIDGERVTKNDVIDIINGQPDIKEDNTEYIETLNNITIKNDSGLENEKNNLYKKATTKNEVLKGLTDNQKNNITDEQLTELVELNIDYKEKTSSNTPEGNRNAQKIDEQIQTITNAIQESSTEEISLSKQPKTSPEVGTGDTEGAVASREIAPEQAETPAQPAEEVETQVEDDASEVIAGQDVRKIGEFEVTFSDENKIVEVKKNGKVVPEKSRTNIEKKLIEQGQINLMPNEEVEVEGITNPVKVTEKILEESNNPGEIAGAIENVENLKKEQKELLKEVKQSGLESLFGTKFTPESIVKVTGLKISELGKGFRNTWVSKTGQNIEDGFIDDNGNVFEVNEVVEFIQENPNVTTFNNKLSESTTQLVKDLKEKFKELTGIRATKGNLKAARETTPESIQELATTEMAEVKKAEAEKPIIEKKKKQTKPKKEKTKEEPTEIDKTVDELGTKGVDKIDAKILRLNFGNAYAYIKNTLARGKGVINVMQEQLRSAPTTAVDYILGNENSTLFYRKLFLPLVKSYQQYADRFRQKEKIILESQDSLLKESKGDRNKAKINGYRIAIAQKAKIHEANPDSDVTPPVLDMLNFTIRLGKAGKLMGVNRKTALALEKLRDEYIKDGGITFENVYNSLSPTQKKVYNLLQEENSKLEPFALKAAERRGLTLEMLNDYSHRVVVGTRNEEIDIADKQAKDFSGETTRGKNLLERTEGVKAVSFDPFLSSLRGTQEVYLDYYMSPDVSNVQKIAAGLVKKYENGNDGQVAATIGIEETIRELLRVSYLRSFVPSGYGTTIATEAKRIGYRLLLGSAPRFAAELAGNSAMLMAEKPSVVMDAITKYGSFSMKVGAKANNKYINMLTELGSGETDKLGGRLEADSKYSDRSGILNISQGERGLYNNFLNKLDQLTRLPKKLTYDNIAKASDFLMAGGDRTISRPIWVSKFANEFKENVKQEFGENIDITVKDLDEIAEGESKYLTDSKYKKAIDKAVRDADRTVISISTSANPFNAIAKNVKRGDVKDYYRTINSFMANFTLNEYATARQAIGALVNSGEMSSRRAGFLLAGVLARMSSYVIAYGILADLLDEEILNAPDDDDEELDSLIYRQLIGSVMTLMFRQNLGNIPSLPVNLGIEEFNKQYLDELRDGKPYNSYDNSIVYSLITLDRLDKGIDKQILPILTGPYVEYYKTARRAIELYNRTQTRKTKEARDRAVKELEEVIVPQIIGQLGFIPLYKDYIRSKRKKFYAENYDRSSGSSGGGGSLPAER
jgi:hypothetical protein